MSPEFQTRSPAESPFTGGATRRRPDRAPEKRERPRSGSRASAAGRPRSPPQPLPPRAPERRSPPPPPLRPAPAGSRPRCSASRGAARGSPPAGQAGPAPAAPAAQAVTVTASSFLLRPLASAPGTATAAAGGGLVTESRPGSAALSNRPKKPPRSAPTCSAGGHPPGAPRRPRRCGRRAPAPGPPRAPGRAPPAPPARSRGGRRPRRRRAGGGGALAARRPRPLAAPSGARAEPPAGRRRRPGLRGSPGLPPAGRAETATPPRRPAPRPLPHTRPPGARGPGARAAPGSRGPRPPPGRPRGAPAVRPSGSARSPSAPDGSRAPSPVPARLRPRRLAPSSTQTSSGAAVQHVRGDMARPPVTRPARGSPPPLPLRPAGARRSLGPLGRRLRTGRPGRHRRTGGGGAAGARQHLERGRARAWGSARPPRRDPCPRRPPGARGPRGPGSARTARPANCCAGSGGSRGDGGGQGAPERPPGAAASRLHAEQALTAPGNSRCSRGTEDAESCVFSTLAIASLGCPSCCRERGPHDVRRPRHCVPLPVNLGPWGLAAFAPPLSAAHRPQQPKGGLGNFFKLGLRSSHSAQSQRGPVLRWPRAVPSASRVLGLHVADPGSLYLEPGSGSPPGGPPAPTSPLDTPPGSRSPEDFCLPIGAAGGASSAPLRQSVGKQVLRETDAKQRGDTKVPEEAERLEGGGAQNAAGRRLPAGRGVSAAGVREQAAAVLPGRLRAPFFPVSLLLGLPVSAAPQDTGPAGAQRTPRAARVRGRRWDPGRHWARPPTGMTPPPLTSSR
ncbi:collagen alpha-1(I) chain-like [Hippopotamus amphibius kiboko]|uniref:collagen alpha-1(I) chain-like n=1 Tax=Hippopotamus amphibius kiboko TaxID=575201 RepID=UPI002592DA1D|nr:collagen alpha-1(I) chain-like [Hippopotamus amphibius kiboko]